MKYFLMISIFISSLFADSFVLNEKTKENIKSIQTKNNLIVNVYITENIKKEYILKQNDIKSFFIYSLIDLNDSIHSPYAFEIIADNKIVRCIKKSKFVVEYQTNSCSIKRETESFYNKEGKEIFYTLCEILPK